MLASISKILQRLRYYLSLTDDQLYSAVANPESLERAKAQKQDSQWPTQSQEHVYEFEGSFSNRSMESTYAEVGPFGALVRENVCCSRMCTLVTLLLLLAWCSIMNLLHTPLKRYNVPCYVRMCNYYEFL